VAEPSFDSHDEPQHFVVAATWKHDMAGEELVKAHAHRPQIDGAIICHKNYKSNGISYDSTEKGYAVLIM